jgi:high-affinity Fe2+/Pb2+ permease
MAEQPRKRKRTGGAIGGAIFGLIFGIGLGLFLGQVGTVDMTSKSSLLVPGICLVLGALAGAYGGRPRKT